MKGDSTVIQHLNGILTIELTTINQHFLHARMFKNWGFEELNEKEYKKSIKDMKQADKLIERILFLEGLPNLQELGKLLVGEHPEEMLRCNLTSEMRQLEKLREAIAYCEEAADYVSRELLEGILSYEEEYVDWLETQFELITNTGLNNYLESQIS